MKTKTLSISLIILMLGISLSTVAADEDTTRLLTPPEQEGFQACINLYPDNIVQFQVEKQGNEKVRLRVYTEGGTLIYTYSLKKHKCARIGFDTSKLKPGKYQYVIEKGKEEVIRKTIEKKNSDS